MHIPRERIKIEVGKIQNVLSTASRAGQTVMGHIEITNPLRTLGEFSDAAGIVPPDSMRPAATTPGHGNE